MNDASTPHWDVHCEQRRITIAEFPERAGHRLGIALDHGEQAYLMLTEAASADALVAALDDNPRIGLLPADGGLPATLPVAESLALALTWDSKPALGGAWDRRLDQAFGLCGFTAEESATLSRHRPLDMARSTRWRLGFIRYLVRPPELLIYDRVFAGCTPGEAKCIADCIVLFHTLHPFRATLRLDLALRDTPPLPDHLIHSAPWHSAPLESA